MLFAFLSVFVVVVVVVSFRFVSFCFALFVESAAMVNPTSRTATVLTVCSGSSETLLEDEGGSGVLQGVRLLKTGDRLALTAPCHPPLDTALVQGSYFGVYLIRT